MKTAAQSMKTTALPATLQGHPAQVGQGDIVDKIIHFKTHAAELMEELNRHLAAAITERKSLDIRIADIERRLAQVKDVIGIKEDDMTELEPTKIRRRRDLYSVKNEAISFLKRNAGVSFSSHELKAQIPELEGKVVALVLRSLIASGDIKLDKSAKGRQNTRYYAE